MADQLTVTALKGFDNAGTYVKRGTQIAVSELHARELERNGLIARENPEVSGAAEKAAPRPKNKKATDPSNKATP